MSEDKVRGYFKGLERKNNELSAKNQELIELYEKHAEAELTYNVQYAKKLISLRMEGEPITLAKDLAKGDKIIADLFYTMRIAEGVLGACREKIKDLRSSIDTYRTMVSYEKAKVELR